MEEKVTLFSLTHGGVFFALRVDGLVSSDMNPL